MGKTYVKFMVDNPEYLKFIFETSTDYPVIFSNNHFEESPGSAFVIFKELVIELIDSKEVSDAYISRKILMLWSTVHGLAYLLVKKNLVCKEDYMDLVDSVIGEAIDSL